MTRRPDRTLFRKNPAAITGNVLSWSKWQRDVLRVLRTELRDLVQHLHMDEVDWPSWQPFYDQGRTPRAAVARALERDL